MVVSIPIARRDFKDLSPCDLGRESCCPGHTFGPAIRNNYLIHYVISGKGMFYKDGCAYPVKSGEIFIIRPREVTTYAADVKDPWHYIWVGFLGSMAEKLYSLPEPVMSYGANTFFDLLRAAELVGTREEFVTAKLFEMMSYLFESKKQTVKYEEQVANFINANYMNPITVDSISELFNLDRRYLSRLFKKRMGVTVSEYLIKTRLKHAAILLSDGYPVNRAAAMAGYQDPFNFSKMFKKVYGVSPMVYRLGKHES